jgi:hypothetical protein
MMPGVRLGGQVAKDMVAVSMGHAHAVLSYFRRRPPPKKPQELTFHDRMNLRLPTYGELYAWEFEKNGRELTVRVDGRLVFNKPRPESRRSIDRFGLGPREGRP